jgi:hypothetical protein
MDNVEVVGPPPPVWADWSYSMEFLPASFHSKNGQGSFSQPCCWLKAKPLAPLRGQAASYGWVEKVLLTVGLAIRDIHAAVFLEPDNLKNYPSQVANSPLEVKDLEVFLRHCQTNLK